VFLLRRRASQASLHRLHTLPCLYTSNALLAKPDRLLLLPPADLSPTLRPARARYTRRGCLRICRARSGRRRYCWRSEPRSSPSRPHRSQLSEPTALPTPPLTPSRPHRSQPSRPHSHPDPTAHISPSPSLPSHSLVRGFPFRNICRTTRILPPCSDICTHAHRIESMWVLLIRFTMHRSGASCKRKHPRP
jgi:hypothetical protein